TFISSSSFCISLHNTSHLSFALSLSIHFHPPPPKPTLFPYTTLFRSLRWHRQGFRMFWRRKSAPRQVETRLSAETIALDHPHTPDRKSTRLNSSHVAISYAVFCLKKKKVISGRVAVVNNTVTGQ